MDHRPSPLTLFADLFVRDDIFNIIIMLEYTWVEEMGSGGVCVCVKINERRENITPADIVLTVRHRANAGAPSSLTNAGEAIDPPVNLFSCISSTVSPQRKGTPTPP